MPVNEFNGFAADHLGLRHPILWLGRKGLPDIAVNEPTLSLSQ